MKKYLSFVFVLLLFFSFACKSTNEAVVAVVEEEINYELPDNHPVEGIYEGSGWGTVELSVEEGKIKGTYTDTWQDEKGYIELWFENGIWKGIWEEKSIDRSGEIYDIVISENGKKVTGLYNVIKAGGHSTFEDEKFIWIYQE